MLKKLILLPLIVSAPLFSQAQGTPTCNSVTSCLQQSYHQNLARLPYYIHEQYQSCMAHNQDGAGKDKFKKCQKEIIEFSKNALSCQTDASRLNEAEKYDSKLTQTIIKDNGEVPVPENVQKLFSELTQIAEANFPFTMKKPTWILRAYNSKTPNAHAGANGEILISNSFWTSKANFTLPEIAGILGHEIGHVIHRDSLRLGCLAYEWVGSDLPLNIEEITAIFREDFSTTIPRGQQWSQLSQSLELNADRIGKQMLELAGYDPALMAQTLQKLQALVTEGTSGSHPGFDARVKNLK